MRDLIRKGLDAAERCGEKKEEKIARVLDRHVDAMDDRSTLKRYIYVLGSLICLFWISVLIFPYEVYRAFEKVGNIDDRVVLMIVVMIFGVGMWFTYALFRVRFPDIENRKLGSEFLSWLEHQQNSFRRFHVWIVAVGGGVLNLLALFVFELALLELWYRP